ncbi:TPA: hypothetical protein UYA75_001559 [Enterococcus faecalis]|nr:hypothetical protein [Enterococcus faecalis]HEL7520958.1 hypothetical protein [Enterococcus faecalis]
MPVINPIFSKNIFFTPNRYLSIHFLACLLKRSTTIASIAINSIKKKWFVRVLIFKLSERKAPINVIEIKNKKSPFMAEGSHFL